RRSAFFICTKAPSSGLPAASVTTPVRVPTASCADPAPDQQADAASAQATTCKFRRRDFSMPILPLARCPLSATTIATAVVESVGSHVFAWWRCHRDAWRVITATPARRKRSTAKKVAWAWKRVNARSDKVKSGRMTRESNEQTRLLEKLCWTQQASKAARREKGARTCVRRRPSSL